jgi:leucyl-tRNA synthetase
VRTYDPSTVEAKWQREWEKAKLFEANLEESKNPAYHLVMFPYPSGDKLHVGHWYNFAPADSYARYMRMKGKDVFEPMGFDAFGLPAENYAIKTGVPPAQSIKQNVGTMIEQLKRMGCMYDWKRMLNTSEPEYYRWTQWLFLQMYKNKLSYRKQANVNWCPKDQTVLANEQVKDGCCDRCGTEVIQKALTQWFWKITDYAEQLLSGLDTLDWPEKTKLMQQHWIGKSEGAEIIFKIKDSSELITVFTTRPDTLFGVTYAVLAPEHPLVDVITPKTHKGAVDAYREEVKKKTEMQRTELNKNKTGVWTGAHVIHPVTGEELPLWIADYVLMNYGTGAVMAVPAHDERDGAFAKAYDLPFKKVVEGGSSLDDARDDKLSFTGDGIAVDSDFLTGLPTHEAKKKMIAWLEDEDKGRGRVTYRLRDWLISRQRYWGAPIPIVYDPEGNPQPIPEKHLPWLLPTDVEFKPDGQSPLRGSKELQERVEKIFGKGFTPEYDTMDTFVCSSFYYLRFLMEGNPEHFVDPHKEHAWMPVSMYIGGPEHATMHLIYARFVMMALKDFGIVSHSEPFQKLMHQGLITNKGAKMSKSKGNVVSPDEYVAQYGSDVFRMFLMFMGPFSDGGDWSDTGIKGIDRFVQRLHRGIIEDPPARQSAERVGGIKKVDQSIPQLEGLIHITIKKVTESIECFQFNTALSALMECLNGIEEKGEVGREQLMIMIRLLAPLAPHLSDELWQVLKGEGFVINQPWPSFDPQKLKSDTMTIAVQVNGKLRGTISVSADASEEDIKKAAKAEPGVAKYLETGAPKKVIYVKNKLVSFVV